MSNQLKRVGFGSGSGGSSVVKATVANVAALPLTGNTIDDLRYVISEEAFYRWNGSAWVTNPGSPKFQDEFISSDFVLNGSEYWLEYEEADHLKGTSPIVQVLEMTSGQYSTLIVTIEVTNAGVVRIRVPSAPDLRFDGKIIIN